MSNTFKYLDNPSKQQSSDDAAQTFLSEKLSKNKFTQDQFKTLEDNGGSKDFRSEYQKIITNQDEIDAFNVVTGGGTSRYADYSNSNNGDTAFTDSWQDGAKYQQLIGSGSLSNESFNKQFASARGGKDTGTVADDGGGWKLIKQDKGKKTNERKLQYKDIAQQWQAAGYDVRVQDHNPDFEGGTGEIAVRVSGNKKNAPKPIEKLEKIEQSPEIEQAKERVRTYEDNILSGKTSEEIYGSGADYTFDATKGAAGIGTPMNGSSGQQADKATASFLDNKKQDVKKKYQFIANS